MKKLVFGILAVIIIMVLTSQSYPNLSEDAFTEQTNPVHSNEDMQASLLSVNAGGALVPFILVLGPGGAAFFAYMNRQRKKQK